MAEEGFLLRWARRKTQAKAKAGVAPAEAPHPSQPEDPEASLSPAGKGIEAEGHTSAATDPQTLPPTLEDVAKLTRDCDFRRFVAPTVDPAIKNAALKKLFADPHFNVMDGLDVYIDDYGKPSPIPAATLRQLVQAHGLGLFDEDEPAPGHQPPAKGSPDGAASVAVPQSPETSTAVPLDENADLRLQQDDAAGCGGAEERPPT